MAGFCFRIPLDSVHQSMSQKAFTPSRTLHGRKTRGRNHKHQCPRVVSGVHLMNPLVVWVPRVRERANEHVLGAEKHLCPFELREVEPRARTIAQFISSLHQQIKDTHTHTQSKRESERDGQKDRDRPTEPEKEGEGEKRRKRQCPQHGSGCDTCVARVRRLRSAPGDLNFWTSDCGGSDYGT